MKRTVQSSRAHTSTRSFWSQEIGLEDSSPICYDGGQMHSSRFGKHDDHATADALLAREISQLSVVERQWIEEEIHGVNADVIEETDELVSDSLVDFQTEIDATPKKPAYEQALFMSPSYVKDRSLRLMFLRADRFDTRLAAKRFIKFFETKLFFWGPDRLCRECFWDDLDEDDRAAVRTGSIFFSDHTDQAGRRIVTVCQKREKFKCYKNQIRNVWYQLMNAVKDEEVQRKGFVKVVFNVNSGEMPTIDRDLFFKGAPAIFEALPFRMAAMHFCYDDPMIRPVLNLVQRAIGRQGRVRFRSHFGSFLECQYSLATFGIPKSYIPFDEAGELQSEKIQLALEILEKENVRNVSADTLIVPSFQDVLLGRGKPFQTFPGNVKLGLIVDQYRSKYAEAGRCDKAIIIEHVVDFVNNYGGRFLKRAESTGGVWQEVSKDTAYDKVGHCFRAKPKSKVATKPKIEPRRSEMPMPDESLGASSSFFSGTAPPSETAFAFDSNDAKRPRLSNGLSNFFSF